MSFDDSRQGRCLVIMGWIVCHIRTLDQSAYAKYLVQSFLNFPRQLLCAVSRTSLNFVTSARPIG